MKTEDHETYEGSLRARLSAVCVVIAVVLLGVGGIRAAAGHDFTSYASVAMLLAQIGQFARPGIEGHIVSIALGFVAALALEAASPSKGSLAWVGFLLTMLIAITKMVRACMQTWGARGGIE